MLSTLLVTAFQGAGRRCYSRPCISAHNRNPCNLALFPPAVSFGPPGCINVENSSCQPSHSAISHQLAADEQPCSALVRSMLSKNLRITQHDEMSYDLQPTRTSPFQIVRKLCPPTSSWNLSVSTSGTAPVVEPLKLQHPSSIHIDQRPGTRAQYPPHHAIHHSLTHTSG